MKNIRTSALLVAAPVLIALALPADEVGFHPKANTELAKKLTLEIELKVEDLSFDMNGQSVSPQDMGAMGDESLLVNLLVGVTDKYVDTKDGRPTDLLRTFDELKLTGEFGDEKKPAEKFDELEGHTVRFKWNEESQEYDRSFHESKGDADELEHLLEDMDLRVLLPEKKVADGDTWEVTGDKLAPLFLPGGVPGKPGGDEGSQPLEVIQEELKAEFEKLLKDFKVVCKYKGARDVDNVHVGAIQLSFDGKADVDLSHLVERLSELDDSENTPDVEAKVGLSLKGEGELLWDLAAGHVHSFDMQSDLGVSADIKASIDANGQDMQMSMSGRVAGKATWSLSTSKP